jgi:tetratricopeptide (TPR) repeat protein
MTNILNKKDFNKELIRAYLGKGAALSRLEEFDKAINCYDEVINLAQNTKECESYLIDAYSGKANSLTALKEFDKAINYSDKVIKLATKGLKN